jgi:hypothetical protein
MTIHLDDEDTNKHSNGQNGQSGQNGRAEVRTAADGCVQFTSIVSASFMLVHCPNWMSCDLISLVDQMHKVKEISKSQDSY